MTAETLTLVSGVVLLLLIGLVGWNLRRSTDASEADAHRPDEGSR